jgi:hypothetical protein
LRSVGVEDGCLEKPSGLTRRITRPRVIIPSTIQTTLRIVSAEPAGNAA